MTDVFSHAIPQVEPTAVGVHLLWTGPWQWVWSLDGWSIQRQFKRTIRDARVRCVRRRELAGIRRTHRRGTSLGPVTLGRAHGWTTGAESTRSRAAEPTTAVTVTATAGRLLAIALRGNQAVGHVSGVGIVGSELRADGITSVVVYALKISALEWCAVLADQESEDRLWKEVPFLVKNLQLPLTELVPGLGSASVNSPRPRLACCRATASPTRTSGTSRTCSGSHWPPFPARPADQVAAPPCARRRRGRVDGPRSPPGARRAIRRVAAGARLRLVRRRPAFPFPGESTMPDHPGSFPAEDLADRVSRVPHGARRDPAPTRRFGSATCACVSAAHRRRALDPTAVDAGAR